MQTGKHAMLHSTSLKTREHTSLGDSSKHPLRAGIYGLSHVEESFRKVARKLDFDAGEELLLLGVANRGNARLSNPRTDPDESVFLTDQSMFCSTGCSMF